MKILKTASLGFNFIGSYKILVLTGDKVREYFSVMVSGNDCKYCNALDDRKQLFKGFKIIFPYCAKCASCITSRLL